MTKASIEALAGPSRKVAFLAAVGMWFLCSLPLMFLDRWLHLPEMGMDFLKTVIVALAACTYVEIRRIPDAMIRARKEP